jgi:hypothetical protein
VGENWFLVGETAGFADPILSAGMTLTQTGARELAFTLIELIERDAHDPAWLKQNYDQNQRARIRQHIRFADYWYACNGQFTDLQAHCAEIARDAGLDLSPQKAWAWLAQGGFANDVVGQAGIGGCSLAVVKTLGSFMGPGAIDWQISGKNRFTLMFEGAVKETLAVYQAGCVEAVECLVRGGRKLPLTGFYDLWAQMLRREQRIEALLPVLQGWLAREIPPEHRRRALGDAFEALEVMVSDGWVEAGLDPERNRLELGASGGGRIMHWDDATRTAPLAGRD